MNNHQKVLVVDQSQICLCVASDKGKQLGIQVEKLELPSSLPPAIERVKKVAEEFAAVFYDLYLKEVADNYDCILLDSDWVDAIGDGCRYCHAAFNVLEKLGIVKLIECHGTNRPTFAQALDNLAVS
ncbi:MAG TPA: hypothetical protein V6C91_03875 [Coleofasciculaceae cyanobacterium]|jgi:hypothetical protein